MGNWVKCHRSLAENELWLLEPFTKGQAFWDLVMKANHADGRVVCGNEVVKVKRGQLFTSELKLAKRWRWSRNKVRAYLKLLENLKMGTAQGTAKGTLITIENYRIYQGEGTEESTTHSTEKGQREVQHKDSKRYTNKKNKEESKKNKEIYIMPALGEFENILLSEEELEKLKERFPYDWQERIDRLSTYIASKGKRYKSHYATILTWARKDKEKQQDDGGFMNL